MPKQNRPDTWDVSHVLIPADEIRQRVSDLANHIDRDYSRSETLLLVGILRGAFIFMADLTRQLSLPHVVDFMAVSSYGKDASHGEVRILMDLREAIDGRHVLIVEDIVDSGQTLEYLYALLKARRPASLRTCVMARKKRPNLTVSIDYLGFELPDVWVVGYGLDYSDQYRTLPFIAELRSATGARRA